MLCCISINRKQMDGTKNKKIQNIPKKKKEDSDDEQPISIRQMQLQAIESINIDEDDEIK